MKFLSRLNPANHLYIKLFLWFWIATVIMMSGSIWTIKLLNDEVRFGPMRQADVIELNNYKQILQEALERRGAGTENLDRILLHVSKRHQIDLILVDVENNTLINTLPPHVKINEDAFLKLSPAASAISIDIGLGTFVGPSIIVNSGKSYLLFVGKRTPPRFMGSFKRQNPMLILAISLAISAILCLWFARSLVNPIEQLQEASKQMAAGNLTIRVGSASKRHDEIGRLGRDFNYMSEQVERLMSSQKRLLADISHELRSPLARLQLSIGILQQQSEDLSHKPIDSRFLHAFLARIEKEAGQIEQMISQVLTLSRLDNPQSIMHKVILDIQSLLDPVVSDARFEAQEQNKEVSFSADNNYTIEGDSQMLSSAIENVLRNAIYYANKEIKLVVSQQDRYLKIVICDDGKGIEQEQLSRVFEPFYRESLARDRASGGVGLGLAIAQQAITQHSGSIQAQNIPSSGLQVTILLPLHIA
jgi:two-component system sensor histidine kinase CpxA